MTALLDWKGSSPLTSETLAGSGLLDLGAVNSLKTLLLHERLTEAEAAASLRVIRQSINQLQGLELTLISAARRANIGAADGLVGAGWVARESRQGGATAARNIQLSASTGCTTARRARTG